MNIFWQTAHASTISLPQASTYAVRVDHLHDFLWYLSIFFMIIFTAGILMFVTKYHRSKKGRETAYILGSHTLELIWTVIPLILMLVIFAWGYKDYLILRKQPTNPYEINVIARQWMWTFEYTNGRKTMNELYLPKDRDVKLIMTSEDVLHSFFVPNFRIKNDVVPGMYSYIAVHPIMEGIHPVYCAEYCGTGHSDMLAKAVVLEQADFDQWLATGKVPAGAKVPNHNLSDGPIHSLTGAPAAAAAGGGGALTSLADKGKDLVNSKGCFACHSTDGTKKIGPTFKGAFGREEELEAGGKITVDENYIRESLMEPQKKIVKGYPPSMPTFKGLLSDDEINALIAYIKSLK